MGTYIHSIYVAIAIFIVIAGLITVPYMLYSYHKYGAVLIVRSLVFFSFVLYMLVAYFQVILPLPSRAEVAAAAPVPMQLHPFAFVRDFLDKSGFVYGDRSTYLGALKSSEFYEPFFNVLLTLPFGAYMTYFFRGGIIKVTGSTFLLSLFYELTQLSGLYGIYDKAYRYFSVDDLILNTFGGFLGFFLGLVILSVLPSKKQMDRTGYERSQKVGYIRRLLGIFVDFALIGLLSFFVTAVFGAHEWIEPLIFFLYFAGLSILLRGRTPGKMIVQIRLEKTAKTGALPLYILLRYALVAVSFGAQHYANLYVTNHVAGRYLPLAAALSIGILGLYLLSALIGLLASKRLWYEYLSRTKLVSTYRRR